MINHTIFPATPTPLHWNRFMPRPRKAPDAPSTGVFVDDYLPALLAQASHLISGEFHRIVTAKGFTVSEWRVLASLAGGKAIAIGELANISTMKQPTVTRILDRMEAKGEVRRITDRTDRRVTRVRITAKGARAVEKLIPLAHEHSNRVLAPFGLERAAGLTAMLQQMIAMHRAEPSASPSTSAARSQGDSAFRANSSSSTRPASRSTRSATRPPTSASSRSIRSAARRSRSPRPTC
jgi:DNA-binding MarR family transcriptional regulator